MQFMKTRYDFEPWQNAHFKPLVVVLLYVVIFVIMKCYPISS